MPRNMYIVEEIEATGKRERARIRIGRLLGIGGCRRRLYGAGSPTICAAEGPASSNALVDPPHRGQARAEVSRGQNVVDRILLRP